MNENKVLALMILGAGLILDFSVIGLVLGIPITVAGFYLLFFRKGRR